MHLRGVVLAGLVVALLGLMAGAASAAFKYSFTGDLEAAGGFGRLGAGSVAVDDGDGKTYVADSGAGAVDVFETATGTELAPLDVSLTPTHTFGGSSVEVAANNATGDVYVLDSKDGVIDEFDAAGGYVCQITGSGTPSASECNGAAGSDTPAHGLGVSYGIAVDQATGEVFAVDLTHQVIDVFGVGGAYLRQISLASVPGGAGFLFVSDIAVDDFNGRIYLGSDATAKVYELDALSGAYVATWNGENTPAGSFGNTYVSVAAHNASGDVYVTDSAHEVTDVFGPGGEYLTQITESATGTGGGVGTAVDQANANVYVSDNEAKVAWVFDALFVPDVATSAATGVRPTSVTLNGDVDPDGVPVTACFFEYGTDSSYGQSVPCTQSPGSGTSPVAVSADLSGLQEGVTYRYRLVAENANGANQSADAEITTPAPPSIDSASAENLLSGSADLRAAIDPRAAVTSYRFEYGTSTAYGASVPLPEGSISAGLSDRTVIQHVTGLQANTTYHWRVVAQNIAGATVGADHTFVYDTGGEGLPDNRAYELVSPPKKNGALLGRAFFAPGLPEVAEDGSRVMTFSVQCFEASVACNANRGNNGDSYALTRTADGWTASEFAPPATQLEANDLLSYNANSDMALFSAQPIPGGQDHLYVEGSTGAVVDIGPAGPPGSDFSPYIEVAATPDYSHVVYGWDEEQHLWPFDATSEAGSLYEYVGVDNAQPTLVGVSGGPGSTDLISVCGTKLGSVDLYVPNSISSDGSVVFFMARECASGSGANAGVAVSADTLYARIDESRTVLISGRSPRDCTGGCLTSTPQAAEFWGASSDGSRAFFTSRQRLVDAASEGGENLYEYDSSRPEGENLSVVSAGDTSGEGPGVTGVEAISPDGSHVYFAATGVLRGVANSQGQLPRAGGENLYVYQRDAEYPQGTIAFIATLPSSDSEFSSDLSDNITPGFAGGPGLANVTPDGRFLVFLSRGRLTADDSSVSGAAQVFRYDAKTGALVRISIGENGFNDNGNAGVEFGDADIVLAADSYPRTDPTMSHDGSYVFFESPVALTPHALNDVQIGINPFFRSQPAFAQNVYEWHEGHVHLISDGRDTSALAPYSANVSPSEALSSVTLLGSDATGANAFFSTADRLAPQDIDTQVDYYDARICSEQSPCIASAPSGSGCAGEACRGTPAGAPSFGSPVSAAFAGAGNQTPSAAPVTKAKKQAQRKVKKRRARSRRPKHAAKHASRRTGIRQASRSTRRSK